MVAKRPTLDILRVSQTENASMPMKRDLRAKWVEAGYSKIMGSAEVVPPPPPEKIRAYHLTTPEFGVNDIALKRLKVARLSDLNDPFELLAVSFGAKPTRSVVRKFKDETDNRKGLISFSANWTNPVLWSHYGAKHQGICLGFDLNRTDVQLVQYQADRLAKKLSENDDPNSLDADLQSLLMRTKFGHWEYEQEIRRFVDLSDAIKEGTLYFHPFGPDLQLKEVILGPECRISTGAMKALIEPFGDVVSYKSRLAFKSFAVVPDERSV
jgi:hypothetical protein